jgi:protein TonB
MPPAAAGDGAAATVGLPLIVPRGGYQVIPRYPESARHAGAQGTTVLRVRVLPDGSVAEVLVDRSAGHADLDTAAVDAVRRWRFEPARRGGEPVAVWILVPVRFTLG